MSPAWGSSNRNSTKRAPGPMTARGDSLGCSRNPGSNYYAGLTHQLMIDLDADDAAKVSVFHSLWVGKAGGELQRNGPSAGTPLGGQVFGRQWFIASMPTRRERYQRFIHCGSAKPVANYYELLRPRALH